MCDLGLCKSLSNDVYLSSAGTALYCAPEFRSEDPDIDRKKCDIYSLGVLLFTMVFGTPPWRKEASTSDTYFRILKERGATTFFRAHYATRDQHKNKTLDKDLVNLISSMISISPCERMGDIRSVLEHPYFLQV